MKNVSRHFFVIQIIVVGLFSIGVLRVVGLFISPLNAAYLDQGDGTRIGSCIGLYPSAHFNSQSEKSSVLSFGSVTFDVNVPRAEACAGSSASAFLSLAKILFAEQQIERSQSVWTLDSRWVALTYGFFFCAVALLIDYAIKREPRWRITHAFCFVFIVCDPINTLYFGTLFSEPVALLGVYILVAAFVFAARSRTQFATVIFVIGAMLLAFSRAAHFALPMIAATAFFFFASQARIAARLFPIIVAVVVAAVAWHTQVSDSKFALANRANAITHAFAPNAASPNELMRSLGLPARCNDLVGVSWYVTYGHDIRATCPELGDVSASKWLLRALSEPEMLARTAYKSFLFVGNPIQLHLLPDRAEVLGISRFARVSVFDVFITANAFSIRAGVLAALITLVATAICVTRSRPSRAALIALSASCAAVFFVALIGDGFSEFSRHIHLAYSLGFAGAIVACMVAWERQAARKTLLLSSSAFVVGALCSTTLPTAHITPMRMQDQPGLLVISSEIPRSIRLSSTHPLLADGQSARVLQPVDPKVARLLGLRTDMLHWVVAPAPKSTSKCTPFSATVFFSQSRAQKFETCVKNF